MNCLTLDSKIAELLPAPTPVVEEPVQTVEQSKPSKIGSFLLRKTSTNKSQPVVAAPISSPQTRKAKSALEKKKEALITRWEKLATTVPAPATLAPCAPAARTTSRLSSKSTSSTSSKAVSRSNSSTASGATTPQDNDLLRKRNSYTPAAVRAQADNVEGMRSVASADSLIELVELADGVKKLEIN